MIQVTMMLAFLIGEVDNGLMHKDCIYESVGMRYTITIKNYKLCPLSIDIY